MRFVVEIESTAAGWRATCNEPRHLFTPPAPDNSATAVLRLNGDPHGAHEVLMPKCGLVLERRLAEAALLALLEYLAPAKGGGLSHREEKP